MEKLEQAEQRWRKLSHRDTRVSDADAQVLRLENEALAWVLAAVLKAYPAGADITFE